MTVDLIRSHVHELTGRMTDRDGREHPGIWLLLAVQLRPVRMDAPSGGHHKVSGSPAPWASDVAGWLTDLAAGARQLEETLRWTLHSTVIHRGGSDTNTSRALRDIPDLAASLQVMHPTDRIVRHLLIRAESDLASWVRSGRLLLGVDQRPIRLPLVPCPAVHDDGTACGSFTLRQMPEDGRITCLVCRTVWTSADWLGAVVAS